MRADARAKRGQLVAAARELFAEQGIEVPFSSVAARAGVGIATLYRHFPTRDDLVMGVALDVRGDILALIERAESGWSPDPAAAWESFVRNLAALRLGTLAANLGPALSGQVAERAGELRASASARLAVVLGMAADEGLVEASLTPERFQIGMATLTRALPATAVVPVGGEFDWLVGVFLRGLRPADVGVRRRESSRSGGAAAGKNGRPGITDTPVSRDGDNLGA